MSKSTGIRQLARDIVRRRARLNADRETETGKKKRAQRVLHQALSDVVDSLKRALEKLDPSEAKHASIRITEPNDHVHIRYAEYELIFYLADNGPEAKATDRFRVCHYIRDAAQDNLSFGDGQEELEFKLSQPAIRKVAISSIRRCMELNA